MYFPFVECKNNRYKDRLDSSLLELSGIYAIINIEKNRVYIGKAVNFLNRYKDHYSGLKHKYHQNKKIDKDINKSSIDKFVFVVLEISDKTNLFKLEENWMCKFVKGGIELYNQNKSLNVIFYEDIQSKIRIIL